MEFVNLRRNILSILGNYWRKTGSTGYISLNSIQKEFSDIPNDDLKKQINSLENNGYIKLSSGGRRVEITAKGLERLKIIHAKKNDEELVIAKKLN